MKIDLEKIESLIGDFAGKDVIPLVRILRKRKNVSEFKLAERMKLGVNQVRNMLYRMNEYNLVSSTRKKDKKKGWYIYYWTFDDHESALLLQHHKKKTLESLHKKLKDESDTQFYLCKTDKLRLHAAEALENSFRCPECNCLLEIEDKQKVLNALKRNIELLESEVTEFEKLSEAETKKFAEKNKKTITKKKAKVTAEKKTAKKNTSPKKALTKH
ncbi:MAG: hypothetical protein AABW49_00210 [Nanoarchaeota archaeon]